LLKNEEIWIFLFIFLIYAIFTGGPHSWNDISRLALVQSLVEFKKLDINQSMYNIGDDRAFINGKFYSDKPPGTSFVGSLVYFVINKLGLSFQENESLVYFFVTTFSVDLISSVGAVYFYKITSLYIKDKLKYLMLIAYALGTLVFPFSTVFTSHSIVASSIVISFYYIQNQMKRKSQLKSLMISLFFLGFAVLVEYQSFIFVLPLIVYLFYILTKQNKKIELKNLFFGILSFIFPVSLALIYNFLVTESFLDIPYFHLPFFPEDYNKPKIERINMNVVYNMLFSKSHGFFVYSPFYLFYLFFILSKKYKFEKIIFSACFLIILFFNAAVGDPVGACTFGIRKMIPAIPFIMFGIVFYFAENRNKILIYCMMLLVVLSIAINFLGAITNPFMCSGNPIKDAFDSFLKEKCWKNMFLPKIVYEKYGCSEIPALAEPSVNLTKISFLNLVLLISIIFVLGIYKIKFVSLFLVNSKN
jgi:4-amino-4-deoxy-L-arabinose transferase-like glycosyltransferase